MVDDPHCACPHQGTCVALAALQRQLAELSDEAAHACAMLTQLAQQAERGALSDHARNQLAHLLAGEAWMLLQRIPGRAE